jgi:glycosyl transferase family WbsX
MEDLIPTANSGSDVAPHVLAFYLPQFHQVAENDAWHGPGFTEWSVVASSKPLYPGHRQPDLPGELGFYDLRVPETRYQQACLARAHGITGFLYYHYWFGGRRMLGRPFDEVLASGHPDFPFALCWTNESWYRRWQGSIDEMLLEQVYSEEDDVAHIRWLIECFKDPRYIRIEGRPLLTVYRAHLLPDARRTAEIWRAECERAGMEPPWLVMFETQEGQESDPAARGFDASAEFVPHHLGKLVASQPLSFGPGRSHRMFDYEAVASAYLDRPGVAWRRYPCVATGWDNTPRRQTGEALILHDSTPEAYGRWLDEAARRQAAAAGGDGVVFVNAWNEWAEGAHLEPDQFWGRAYLEVTRDVMTAISGRAATPGPPPTTHPQPVPTEELYHDLYRQFVLLQHSASGFLAHADRRIEELKKHYEAKMVWAHHKGEVVTELNEWLYEQLRIQEGLMRELGVGDSRVTDWLEDPGHVFGMAPVATADDGTEGAARAECAQGAERAERAAGAAGAGSGPASHGDPPAGASAEDEVPPVPVRDEEDERRRDDGFDDLPPWPHQKPAPQWLVERGSAG